MMRRLTGPFLTGVTRHQDRLSSKGPTRLRTSGYRAGPAFARLPFERIVLDDEVEAISATQLRRLSTER
jgi:hypothetical protein